jgi:hypothetical protein
LLSWWVTTSPNPPYAVAVGIATEAAG